jgi:hypothetical protein
MQSLLLYHLFSPYLRILSYAYSKQPANFPAITPTNNQQLNLFEEPSLQPSMQQSRQPGDQPSSQPSDSPTTTLGPSSQPTNHDLLQ